MKYSVGSMLVIASGGLSGKLTDALHGSFGNV